MKNLLAPYIGKTFTCTIANFQTLLEPRVRVLHALKSNSMDFKKEDGKISGLDYPKNQKMVEVTPNSFIIYGFTERPLNEEEKAEIERIHKKVVESFGGEEKYKEQCSTDAISDGSTVYYREKHYQQESNLPYLFERGKTKERFIQHIKQDDGSYKQEYWIRDFATPNKEKIQMKYIIS